jgi:hypothetical protein
MPELSFHSCFGRCAGDASKPVDFLSNEWTQVRNKQHKGEQKEKILKSSCHWKFANSNATLEVTPKEQFAYHMKNKQELRRNKKPSSTMSAQSNSNNVDQKIFESYVSNLTEQDIALKQKELLKNEIKLQEEQENMISSLKYAKSSLEHSRINEGSKETLQASTRI